MAAEFDWIFFVTLALISASVIDDLRSRKVHNSLVVWIFVLSLAAALLKSGPSVLMQVLISMLAAFVFCLPLYKLRALGGGDLKLMVALGPVMAWGTVGWTLAYSLVWGSILGLVMVIINRQTADFMRNLTSLAMRNPVPRQQLHKMPYTIAILLGFLTQASLAAKGVSLL